MNNKLMAVALIACILLVSSCEKATVSAVSVAPPCRDTNCSNYTSQSAAQSAFNADPTCRADLDADKDGVACEEPGNTVKMCSTTSNCGCSGKNKSPCEVDPCCRWVVNEGCKCR